jgi:hypothetical protein
MYGYGRRKDDVIPGPSAARSLESILPAYVYGFRARRFAALGMTKA